MRYLILLLMLTLSTNILFAQKNNASLIQFSGVVVSGDSLKSVPFTTIVNTTAKKSWVTDFNGFFSFVAKKGDAIEFAALGYKKSYVKIPDTLKTDRYSLVQVLTQDTLVLDGLFLCPWQSFEQFKQDVVKLKLPVDDMDRAMRNLALAKMKDHYQPMPNDGAMNFRNYINQEAARRYYIGGQMPPNNLLNPFAWARFIKAWENGDFKRKD